MASHNIIEENGNAGERNYYMRSTTECNKKLQNYAQKRAHNKTTNI